MTYNEWLEAINNLNNLKLDNKLLDKLINEPFNPNLNDMIEPKLIDLFKIRINKSVEKIIKNLDLIFADHYSLDLALQSYKKEMNFMHRMLEIKVYTPETNVSLDLMLVNQIEHTYAILKREADKIDPTGVLKMTIKNNEIKWSE